MRLRVRLGIVLFLFFCFFFSSRRRHTRLTCDWSSDVCSSDLLQLTGALVPMHHPADPTSFQMGDSAPAGAGRVEVDVAVVQVQPLTRIVLVVQDRKSVV